MTFQLFLIVLIVGFVSSRNLLNEDPLQGEDLDEIRICRTPNCTLVQDFRQLQVAKAPPSSRRIPICNYNPYNCGCFYPLPYQRQADTAQTSQPASTSSLTILPGPYPIPYPYPGCCARIYSPVCCTVIPGAKCNSQPVLYGASSARPAVSSGAYRKTFSSQCEADQAGACKCSPGTCESTGGGCGYDPVCCTKIAGATCSDSPGSNLNAAIGAFSIDPSARRVTYRNKCEASKAGACKCTPGSCSYVCRYCLASASDGGRRHLLDEDVEQQEAVTCESLQEKYEPCCEEYQVQEGETICGIAEKFGVECDMLMAFHGKDEVLEGDLLQICA
eukprot:TRINITY_DN26657_c0_g1_i7.p1 TRINITY_DN26657_c0_g1~~TRINITY_DN26657_c0_g1_i7.p1  ORF type:complete len:360 (+),score=18.27 TRINITY_DN26657_c0_g1_i7:85-1080(+)